MTPGVTRDHSALRWVRKEIEETLHKARLQLEDYVEQESDDLSECVRHLHQAHGALDLIQVYGAAMLAHEMEALAEALNQGKVSGREAAVEVLMMGLVQLPAYLERVEAGNPDIPLVLMPLMNDLRASRGASLVSEISLFAPKLDSLIAAEEVVLGSGNPALAELVRGQRSSFHRGLLNWYRDIDVDGGLAQIRQVIANIGEEARTPRMCRLFAASEALIAVLQDGSLAPSESVKLLFGQIDRVFRRVTEQGEEAVAREFPAELLKNLLFYIAQSDSQDPTVQAVREASDLAHSFPDITEQTTGQDTLGGPGKDLFQAVGEALKNDLREIKDQLDLYMRGDRGDFARLSVLVDPIRRVGDTLGMVGRGELRSRLMPHCERIADAVTGREAPSDDQLMGLAADLLFVESALTELDNTQLPVASAGDEPQRPLLQALSAGEFREHMQAAIDQGFVELAETKEALQRYLDSPQDVSALASLPQRIHRVTGAMVMMEQPEAARLLDELRGYVVGLSNGDQPLPDEEQCEALADLVGGLELYMESVVDRRPDHDQMLLVAQAASERLGLRDGETGEPLSTDIDDRLDDIGIPIDDIAVGEAIPFDEPADMPQEELRVDQDESAAPALDLMEEAVEEVRVTEDEQVVESVLTEAEPEMLPSDPTEESSSVEEDTAMAPVADEPETPPADEPATPPAPLLDDIDSEIREIFVEEAREELQAIDESYPRWRADRGDTESLARMRRAFHTLKGSGRLVGATVIGELAWSVENLLNRVIDGTVIAGEAVFDLLEGVMGILPSLVDDERSGGTQVESLQQQAFALADGNAPVEQAAAEPSVESPAPSDSEPDIPTQAAEGSDAAAEQSPFDSASEEAPLEPVLDEPAAGDDAPDWELEPMAEPAMSTAEQGPEQALDEPPLEEQPTDVQPEAPFSFAESMDTLSSSLSEQDDVSVAPTEEAALPWEETPAADEPVDTNQFDQVSEPQQTAVEADLDAGVPEVGADEGELEIAPDEDLLEDESILVPSEQGAAPIALDSALYDIFGNETQTHLATIQAFIDDSRGRPAGCVYSEPLVRALHTLRGSANMAEVGPIAELAGALERWVNLNSELELRTDSAAIDLLERAHFVIDALCKAINQSGANLPSWEPLLQEIKNLGDALHQRLESHDAEPALDLDPELVGIFLEEANELSESMELDFGKWQEHAADMAPVAELQRHLHTMKGASRMAGLLPIGDLSHGMESLFQSIVEGRVQGGEPQRALARYALDALEVQVEAVQQGGAPPSRNDIVERLEAAAHGQDWQPIEAALTPEPEQEPESDLETVSMASESTGDAGSESYSALSVEQTTSLETPPESEPAGAVMADSRELIDSQFLTDSELLGDSDFASTATIDSELAESMIVSDPAEGGLGNALQEDSRIIQFPARGASGTAAQQPPVRRPPPPEDTTKKSASSQERVRVRSELLDQMVNNAGEVSIYRARLEQQNKTQGYNLEELAQTIERLRAQLRSLELEAEAQILSRHEREYEGEHAAEFDPLEMDRYSTMQQLSRALSETVNDLGNIGVTLQDMNRDSETLLQQQARVTNDLQDGLLRTRMVPVSSRTSRLQRVVRQTAQGLGKKAELKVIGGQGEMDRAILERMMAPLEHLLRNAVAHGIESPEERSAADKPELGIISLVMSREGADVVLTVSDDGRGFNRDAIRAKAIERGLLDRDAYLDDDDLDQFILEAGFSTADGVSQVAGRGVGMDVVVSEVKQIGGSLDTASQPGRGSSFTIRLPFTLAITESLLVTVADEVYAVPHGSVDGVVRIPRAELEACYRGEQETFVYSDREYQVRYLGSMLSNARPVLPEGVRWFPLLLVRSGEHRVAIQVDGLLGNRQIVVKPVGTQLSSVRWFTGGTILADGRIALILDVNSLVRLDSTTQQPVLLGEVEAPDVGVTVMVVDDSITVRKVTSRLLERHNMQVVTAKDGVDAVAVLQEQKPDVMLLDIEMPRMDGFELARHMRSREELNGIPIIMITSRIGEKHRNLAMELGVKRYLGKPYQESDLLENIYTVLAEAVDD